MKQIFAILGGDARQLSVAAKLTQAGHAVKAYGLPLERLPAEVVFCFDWQSAVENADVVLLPLPASPDGVRINMALEPSLRAPTLRALFEALPAKAEVVGGRFSPAVKAMAQEMGISLFDYCKSEELLQKNALPTAEGALFVLMEKLPRTVHGLSVAVTGYGRVAKALCRLLLAMGAQVTVGARKASALQEAALAGCRTHALEGDRSVIALTRGKDVVFNTVPHWLFSKSVLTAISPKLLLIDLASAPGGVDGEVARGLGLQVIWALSLPGKYAPQTAGEIIAEAVLSHLSEEGEQ